VSVSTLFLDDLGEVKIYKRRGQKNIRLRVDSNGQIKLSLPWYVSKRAGLIYVRSKKDWLEQQLRPHASAHHDIDSVGMYKVNIQAAKTKRASVFLDDATIQIKLPEHFDDTKKLQKTISLIEDIFRKETETRIADYLRNTAKENNIKISEIKVKKLKSRWGSCDNKKRITLNLYLAQLPSDIQKYVVCHELAHTKHLDHGKNFWNYVKQLCPDYKQQRKSLRKFSPGMLNVR